MPVALACALDVKVIAQEAALAVALMNVLAVEVGALAGVHNCTGGKELVRVTAQIVQALVRLFAE